MQIISKRSFICINTLLIYGDEFLFETNIPIVVIIEFGVLIGCLGIGILRHFQQLFGYIVTARLIVG